MGQRNAHECVSLQELLTILKTDSEIKHLEAQTLKLHKEVKMMRKRLMLDWFKLLFAAGGVFSLIFGLMVSICDEYDGT